MTFLAKLKLGSVVTVALQILNALKPMTIEYSHLKIQIG